MMGMTRRRLVGVMAGLGMSGVVPPVFAQQLPKCETEKRFGYWIATASTSSGLATYDSDVTPKVIRYVVPSEKSPLHSRGKDGVSFLYSHDGSIGVFEFITPTVELLQSKLVHVEFVRNGVSTKLEGVDISAGQSEKEKKVWLKLHILEPDLSGVADVVFKVFYANALALEIMMRTERFTEVPPFLVAEKNRLKEMEKNKQCEARCFLTTACCDVIGLDDDCFELKTLRAFRDGALPRLPGGAADIARYYEIAPRIVGEIGRRGDRGRLARFYVTHILPSVFLVKLGAYRAARGVYTDMMKRLERRYL